MARIIETGETPAKKRNAHLRSCAEVLRLLAQRSSFDEEARDMAAFFVFNLRGIWETIDESAQVWEERSYWKKAEDLREKYRWSRTAAAELTQLLRRSAWDDVVGVMLSLMPHLAGVTVTAVTRDADWWVGAYRSLLREAAGEAAV